ncbi:hypothetical protein ACFX2I_009497 [Malus domestica]
MLYVMLSVKTSATEIRSAVGKSQGFSFFYTRLHLSFPIRIWIWGVRSLFVELLGWVGDRSWQSGRWCGGLRRLRVGMGVLWVVEWWEADGRGRAISVLKFDT